MAPFQQEAEGADHPPLWGRFMLGDLGQSTSKAMNLTYRVVVHEGGTHGTPLPAEPQPVHQPWRIHVSVAHPDTRARQRFRDDRGIDIFQVKAQRRHSVTHQSGIGNAEDLRAKSTQDAQELERKRRFVSADRLHGAHDVRSPGVRRTVRSQPSTQTLEVGDCRIHTGDVFVNESANLDFERWRIRNEVLAESGQRAKRFESAPEETHMRGKCLVSGADQIIAAECLHVDRSVGTVMHAVEKDLCADGVREPGHLGYVYDGPDGVGSHRTCHQASVGGKQRLEIGHVQVAVITHAPPQELGAFAFQGQPSGHVGLVVHVGNDDFAPLAQGLADSQADQPYERRGVHAKSHFVRFTRIQEYRHTLPGARDGCVHFFALWIGTAALYVAREQVLVNRIQHDLGDLGTSGVVKEYEIVALTEGRERSANLRYRELGHGAT